MVTTIICLNFELMMIPIEVYSQRTRRTTTKKSQRCHDILVAYRIVPYFHSLLDNIFPPLSSTLYNGHKFFICNV